MADVFDALWQDYVEICPQAEQVQALLRVHDDRLVNDHIALRTIDQAECGIAVMAEPFLAMGYQWAAETYHFEQKHLRAKYLLAPDPAMPRVFISALCLEQLDVAVAAILRPLLVAHPPRVSAPGRPWPCRVADYQRLLEHSEYAAWLLAFGWRANHFTVSVNHLQHYTDIDELVAALQGAGFPMNESGGLIKGSAEQGLRQASTLAPMITVDMEETVQSLPACYVEFAQRYPLDTGELYQGFIAASADKIFESTDRR